MCPTQGMESCQKHVQAQRKRQGCILINRGGIRTAGCINKRVGEKRVCGGFRSWYAYGQQARPELCRVDTMRTSRSPTTVMTANGEVQTREQATVHVKQLDLFVKVMLLEETPAVLSVGKLCEDHGHTYHWTSCQKPHLIRMARDLIAIYPTMCHLWFLVYQRVFPLLHLHLLLHHENPVPERSGSTSEELRGDPLHESTETENKNKNEEREEVQRDISHELPGWLQEFRETLVDESTSTEPWGNQ